MKHTIIVTGWNCEKYAKQCIDSLLNQTVKAHQILIYNDGSTDNTAKVLSQYTDQKNVWIWNHPTNEGALYGRHKYMQLVTGDVVSFVGLDDALREDALEVLNRHYTDDIQLTYGSWQDLEKGTVYPSHPYADEVYENKSFRRVGWKATALNTFRVSLIKQVPAEVLKHNGEYFKNCTDLAYSFPCLERVTKEQVSIVHDPIYLYRRVHQNTTLKRLGKRDKGRVREQLKKIPICK